MHRLSFFLLMVISSISTSVRAIAQQEDLSNNAHKRDTVIIDFLLRHGQFYDIPLSDTSNPKRYDMVKHLFFCDKIIEVYKGNKSISFYGFGSNYSHSRNYLLIEFNDSDTILGTSSLDVDLPRLYNILGNLKNSIKANQKLACYEFLIRNYNLNYPPPMHLINDPNYKKSKK